MSELLELNVVCLCAQWCGTCRDYQAVFEELQAALPEHRYRWIDIEDEAEVVGDVDIETFPTLMVSHQGQVLFAGPVLPRLADAQRLLQVQAQRVVGGEDLSKSLHSWPADQAQAYTDLAQALSA